MIRLIVMDVDGTLTDGGIYIGNNGDEYRKFNAKDGLGIIMAQKMGIDFMILTGSYCESIKCRANHLNIKFTFLNITDKRCFFYKFMKEEIYAMDEIAYIGDDLNDYDCMALSGVTGCPADSVDAIKKIVNYVCIANGGHGAVREFIDWLINSNKV